MKSYHLQQHGWTLQISCQVKYVRQRKILYDITYMWNLKNKLNEEAKQKETHRYREQVDGGQMGGG